MCLQLGQMVKVDLFPKGFSSKDAIAKGVKVDSVSPEKFGYGGKIIARYIFTNLFVKYEKKIFL